MCRVSKHSLSCNDWLVEFTMSNSKAGQSHCYWLTHVLPQAVTYFTGNQGAHKNACPSFESIKKFDSIWPLKSNMPLIHIALGQAVAGMGIWSLLPDKLRKVGITRNCICLYGHKVGPDSNLCIEMNHLPFTGFVMHCQLDLKSCEMKEECEEAESRSVEGRVYFVLPLLLNPNSTNSSS